jgi:hypothetical protein
MVKISIAEGPAFAIVKPLGTPGYASVRVGGKSSQRSLRSRGVAAYVSICSHNLLNISTSWQTISRMIIKKTIIASALSDMV